MDSLCFPLIEVVTFLKFNFRFYNVAARGWGELLPWVVRLIGIIYMTAFNDKGYWIFGSSADGISGLLSIPHHAICF